MSPQRSTSKEVLGGSGAILELELKRAVAAGRAGHTVVLVEGASDRRALETLALRQGRDLMIEGVAIIPTAGITNLSRFLDLLGADGYDVPMAGLCDQPEQAQLRLALEAAGLLAEGADLEQVGFFTCIRDLEDELIRALGAERMLRLIEVNGHLRRFHSFQHQPHQVHKRLEDQIWRWLGNHKIRYAPLMVGALDPERAPQPLSSVLAAV